MGPSPRRRPSGSFAGGAGGSSPRDVSLRRRPAGSSNGGAAGSVPVVAHSPRRRPAGLTDGGAEGSGTVRQVSDLRGRGDVSGPVGGEVPMGERSEDTCCFCDFRGREGRCGSVAVDLLPAAGAVVDGIRQEGWHWCPNHAWRVVELYRVEQRAGRLKPGLSVYLNLVGARLQREAGAGDEMRALAEWGNRLAHVGETRHAEFVRGRYDAEQAVEFARHQLTFAVQEAEMMSARAGDVERVAAGVVKARELELQGEVQQLNERAHSWLRSERDEVAQLGRKAQEAREVARDETLRASELVRQACRERDEGRNDGALARAELQGSRYELRVACEERERLKMEVRLSQRAEAQEVTASRGVAEAAALSGRGDGRLENQLAEAQQEAVRAREEFDRVCSELRGQGERSRLDAGEEVRRLKERVELLTGECRQSDGGGEKLVGETAGLRRGAGSSPRSR